MKKVWCNNLFMAEWGKFFAEKFNSYGITTKLLSDGFEINKDEWNNYFKTALFCKLPNIIYNNYKYFNRKVNE